MKRILLAAILAAASLSAGAQAGYGTTRVPPEATPQADTKTTNDARKGAMKGHEDCAQQMGDHGKGMGDHAMQMHEPSIRRSRGKE